MTTRAGVPGGVLRIKNTPQRVVVRGVFSFLGCLDCNGCYVKQPERGADRPQVVHHMPRKV